MSLYDVASLSNDIRKSHNKERKIEPEQAVKEMEEHRRQLVQEISSKFEKVIRAIFTFKL
jgi:endonuclease I